MGPAPILAAIVGLFHVSAYVFIRGRAGARLPFLVVAAILGAWAGDTVGARLAIDPLRLGEFNLLFASLMAWLAIGLVALLAVLIPERTGGAGRVPITTSATRAPSPEPLATVAPDPEPQAPQ